MINNDYNEYKDKYLENKALEVTFILAAKIAARKY